MPEILIVRDYDETETLEGNEPSILFRNKRKTKPILW